MNRHPNYPDGCDPENPDGVRDWIRKKLREAQERTLRKEYDVALMLTQEAQHALRCLMIDQNKGMP